MNDIDPPAECLFDYDRPLKYLNSPMPCKKCGKVTGTGITDTQNYTHEYIDICTKCMFMGNFTHLNERIVLENN